MLPLDLYLLLRLPCLVVFPHRLEIRPIAAYYVQYNVVSTVRTQHVGFSCLTCIAFDSKVGLIWAEKHLHPCVKLVPSPRDSHFRMARTPGLRPGLKQISPLRGSDSRITDRGSNLGVMNPGRAALQRRVEVASFCSGALAPGLARLKPLFSRQAA